MGIITQIKRTVRRADRCSIYVDGEFFAACPLDVVLGMGLVKGMSMSADIEKVLRSEDRRIVLRQKAFRFATYKPRTVKQVQDFLQAKMATDEETSQVIEWLASFGYLDDNQYAERFIIASKERKPMSANAIRQSLQRKGIPADVVEAALTNFLSGHEVANLALQVAAKKWQSLSSAPAEKRLPRLQRFLAYRGYPWGVVRDILARAQSGLLAAIVIPCFFSVPSPAVRAQATTSCSRIRLPETINRYQPTTLPVLSPDGRLFVDRKLHPNNTDGVNDPDDVWIAEPSTDGSWLAPTQSTFTTVRKPDLVFSFTSDGLCALVAGEYTSGAKRNELALALLTRATRSDAFSSVTLIAIPGVQSLGRNFFAQLSDDRSTLLLALDLPGGNGSLDLYVSTMCNGTWSSPQSLGPTINTSLFEGAPWLAPDGRTLYFSSSGRDNRYGKADLYMSRRIDDSWTHWTTPRNLGSCVNTVEDETAFSLAAGGTKAFVHSWDPATELPAIFVVELPDEFRPLPYCAFSGTVRDARTDSVLGNARLTIVDSVRACTITNLPVDSLSGEYAVLLASGSRYHITTQSAQYVNHHQVVGVRNLDSTVPLRITTTLFDTRTPLASVFFERGAAALTEEASQTINNLVTRYNLRQIGILVVGYTDVVGTKPQNRTLSEERASVVAEFLVKRGIEKERVRATGRGIEVPGTLLTLKENPQSRRVDIFPAELPRRGDTQHR